MSQNDTVDMSRMNNLIVYTAEGQALPLKSFWRNGPAIFVFLRHFSSVACRAHFAQIWAQRLSLEQDGARIYFIGNGSFREIMSFKKEMGAEKALIFTDPSRRTYAAAGLRRGILPSIGLKALANGFGLARQGFRQKQYHRDSGDLWQLGGVLVVNPGGHVHYRYASQAPGDFPQASEFTQMNRMDDPTAAAALHEATADFSIR